MEERYRKELNWWFAELTMDPEVQVERYLTIFLVAAFPRDRYGYSLIAVEVTHDNKIASITSRWNTYTEDSGNFITEEELKKILGEADYDKMLC